MKISLLLLTSLLFFGQYSIAQEQAPVSFNGDTLFYIQTHYDAKSPKERAEDISQNLERLSDKDITIIDSFHIEEDSLQVSITCGQVLVMILSKEDAELANSNLTDLSREYISIFKQKLESSINRNDFIDIMIKIGLAILLIGFMYFLFRLINLLFRRLYKKIEVLQEKHFTGIKFKTLEVLTPDKQLFVAMWIAKALRILVLILILYLTLPLLFSIFPWTRGIAMTLFDYILVPVKKIFFGFINYLPSLFFIVVVIYITRYILKAVKFLAHEVERGAIEFSGFHKEWTKPTYKLVRFMIYAFAFMSIFPHLPGAGSESFKGISIFLGILLSLGSSSAISNIVAGIVITYMTPFKIGDRVRIGKTEGDIIEKTLLVTKVNTIKNEHITIPNGLVLTSHITNFSAIAKDKGVILHTTITIGYDVPWTQVHELLINAAMATKQIQKEPKPFVLQTALSDYYVAYELNAYTREASQMEKTYSDLHGQIQNQFNEAGVEIMSPAFTAVRDGNESTIPSDKLPDDYETTGFKVSWLGNILGKKG